MICSKCNGTGRIVLLTSSEVCRDCGGRGRTETVAVVRGADLELEVAVYCRKLARWMTLNGIVLDNPDAAKDLTEFVSLQDD